jgi:hypothetical protein
MPHQNCQVSRTLLLAVLCLAVSSCGGGGGGGSPTAPATPPVNRAPVASNDITRVDTASLASINVLSNDTDADGDRLTVTIEEAAPIGAAGVNNDGTVRIDSLPGDFKGFTRFKYRVTDPAGLTSTATAGIFVGVEPFRVIFAGDSAANGSNELYLLNLVAPATQLTSATDGALRLRGFAASTNGATVVYRRTSTTTPATSDLSFVRTGNPRQDVHIVFPGSATLVQDAQGADQFGVSADGKWIVAIARDGASADAAYVLNVDTPTTVSKVSIPGTVRASLPRFSSNSQTLYLLASPVTVGSNDDLYAVALSGLAVSQLSAPTAVQSTDDVLDYSVASDQSRILLRANRSGRVGLYYIDTTRLQTETRVSQALGLTDTILESTISLPPGRGGSVLGQRVAYTVQSLLGFSTWLADVSATPNPHSVATSGARARGFRPDDAALTYTRSGQVIEAAVNGSVSDQIIGAGAASWYDSTGNIVLLQQFLPSGGTPNTYPALAVTVRGSFGATQPLGTPVLAAHFIDVSGFDRGVVIIGEGPTTGAAPATARLALVNALAPDKLIYLADFVSPIQLSSSAAQVVSN